MRLFRKVEIVRAFEGKTSVAFWNEAQVGDIFVFERGHQKWHNMTIKNERTNEYAPRNMWSNYMSHKDEIGPDNVDVLYEYVQGNHYHL